MKKTYLLCAAIAVLIFACIYSCQKDRLKSAGKSQTDSTAAMDKDQAESYYYNKLMKAPTSTVNKQTLDTKNSTKNNVRYLMFDLSYQSSNSEVTFIEIPIRYNVRASSVIAKDTLVGNYNAKLKILNASYDRLLIYKSKSTNRIDQVIVTYIPDSAYLQNHHNDISNNHIDKLDPDFNGYIEYKKWDGSNMFLLRIVNGKTIGDYVYNAKGFNKIDVNSLKKTDEIVCTEYYTQHWVQQCYAMDPEGDDLVCQSWELEGTDYYTVCQDNGTGPALTGNPCVDYGYCGTPTPPVAATPTLANSFDKTQLFNQQNGNKPLAEYPDPCSGAQGIWGTSISTSPSQEVFGAVTLDGKFITIATVGFSGGSLGGLYNFDNGTTVTAYYTYPDTQGPPTQTYAGMQHVNGQYFIPIVATVHTHNPCLVDGTNGISNQTLSGGDQSLASEYKNIRHYIIGCNAVGSFSEASTDPTVLATGALASTCSVIH